MKKKFLILLIIVIIGFTPKIIFAEEKPNLTYQAQVQDYGWMKEVNENQIAGTVGEWRRMEAVKIKLSNCEGGITYIAQAEDYGWMKWVENGEIAGTVREWRRMEAIRIKLTGKVSEKYDIYYRAQVADYGWMKWVKNGEVAGTVGEWRRMEALQIKLVPKENVQNTEEVTEPIHYDNNDSYKLTYQAQVQDYGWMKEVNENQIAGTVREWRRMEAVKIKLSNCNGGIKYIAQAEDYGWMKWVENGEIAGTVREWRRMEAIRIELTGEIAEEYDVYYRAQVQDYGWMKWVKNGEIAGTVGEWRRMEALQIKLVPKDTTLGIEYSTYYDNNYSDYASNGETSGTVGLSKPIKGIKIKLTGKSNESSVSYSVYSNYNWYEEVSSDELAGDNNNQIEAIKINLKGKLSEDYDIYYRVQMEDHGWMGWTKNGEIAGSVGTFLRMEAIQIKLLPKNSTDIKTSTANVISNNKISYQAQVANYGWMSYVNENEVSGTTGQGLRMEAIKIKLDSSIGNIEYRTDRHNKGWSSFQKNNEVSGTVGEWRYIEKIEIKLTGKISNYYDIYYRVHTADFCWLGWAKNGETAGTNGLNKRIEAIQIKLVPKNQTFTENTSRRYISCTWKDGIFYDNNNNKMTGFQYIDGNRYLINSSGYTKAHNFKKVIDVSEFQDDINWDALYQSADVDAAIIRVGWGMSTTDEAGTDAKFDRNIKAVQRLKIPYSIYIFGYAQIPSAAEKEANFVIKMMKKYNIPKDTFVWYDAELDLPRSTYNIVIPKFSEVMKNNGYNNIGVYGGVGRLDTPNGNLNSSIIRSFPIWIAEYNNSYINDYTGSYVGWQFQSDGRVSGISGNVDISVFYQ